MAVFNEVTIAHVLVVTDERTSGGWIGWMAIKMIPAAIAGKPAQRMSFEVVSFILLSLTAAWRLVFARLPALLIVVLLLTFIGYLLF